jgi:hypothetical protein
MFIFFLYLARANGEDGQISDDPEELIELLRVLLDSLHARFLLGSGDFIAHGNSLPF